MKFEDAYLRKICPHTPSATRANILPLLVAAMIEYDITTELRVAAFVAQISEESGEFSRWEENLNYSAKRLHEVFKKRVSQQQAAALAHNPRAIANHVYGGRYGNRPGTDDGWRYRGRGPMQLTFRDNYRAVGRAIGVDLEENPDLAATPAVAFKIAAQFFQSHGCNQLADRRAFKQITEVVNGGLNNFDTRLMYYERALRVLPDGFVLTASADDQPKPVKIAPDDQPPDFIEDLRQIGRKAPESPPDALSDAAGVLPVAPGAERQPDGAQAQAQPVQPPAQTPATPVEATAPAKERSKKSFWATISAALGSIGLTFGTLWTQGVNAVKDNPALVFIVGLVVLAIVICYWKYQDRQTRLDLADREHAKEINIEKMKIVADPKLQNVELVPPVEPAPTPER